MMPTTVNMEWPVSIKSSDMKGTNKETQSVMRAQLHNYILTTHVVILISGITSEPKLLVYKRNNLQILKGNVNFDKQW